MPDEEEVTIRFRATSREARKLALIAKTRERSKSECLRRLVNEEYQRMQQEKGTTDGSAKDSK